ncbi:MAG: hypothetical protein LBT46_05535 [Planctomycetaceae bacterium]|jgi:hypothetical protein|nr:hypothetical protein [Planctomycetaceae bacterium]
MSLDSLIICPNLSRSTTFSPSQTNSPSGKGRSLSKAHITGVSGSKKDIPFGEKVLSGSGSLRETALITVSAERVTFPLSFLPTRVYCRYVRSHIPDKRLTNTGIVAVFFATKAAYPADAEKNFEKSSNAADRYFSGAAAFSMTVFSVSRSCVRIKGLNIGL